PLRYFTQTFVDRLRAAVAPIVVLPVGTQPIGSLAERQDALIDELRAQGRRRWHLVGHSTGGVDAALMLRTHRLTYAHGRSVFSNQQHGLLEIGSAIAISAPHHGTGLVGAVTLPNLLRTGYDVLDGPERQRFERLRFVLAGLRHGASLLRNRLKDDLHPDVAGDLTTTDNRRAGARLFSIATMAPPPHARSNRLFHDLWRWTASGPGAAVPAAKPVRTITSGFKPTTIDHTANDGVVNTLRQLDGESAAIVIGDHADVIGHYETRREPALLSGAKFRGKQLDEVVQRVADCVRAAIDDTPLAS
ncbi:MAG TPA: hypothetical protein VLB44_02310, partial [Kofleriaceae bacterium]|nr:hypothetical protein [Kofleriaceae bacterium]